jgi:hypothetical protein
MSIILMPGFLLLLTSLNLLSPLLMLMFLPLLVSSLLLSNLLRFFLLLALLGVGALAWGQPVTGPPWRVGSR